MGGCLAHFDTEYKIFVDAPTKNSLERLIKLSKNNPKDFHEHFFYLWKKSFHSSPDISRLYEQKFETFIKQNPKCSLTLLDKIMQCQFDDGKWVLIDLLIYDIAFWEQHHNNQLYFKIIKKLYYDEQLPEVIQKYLCIVILTRNKIKFNIQKNDLNPILVKSCKRADIATIKYLLKHKANINHMNTDWEGWTPLTIATRYNVNLKTIQFLLNHGASINQPTKTGKTALDIAIEYKKIKFIEFLNKKGAKSRKYQKSGIRVRKMSLN
jgi:hypothetical protein